jgi:hypothetical protein
VNFSGCSYKPETPRWGSQVEWDDPALLTFGVAKVARNMQFREESTKTRFGLVRALVTGQNADITGLGLLNYEGDETGAGAGKFPFIFDAGGRLWREQGQGSKNLTPILNSLLLADCHAIFNYAYGRAYMAQSNLITGTAKLLVFDGKNVDLNQASSAPIGLPWQANTKYEVGDIVSPVSGSPNRLFRVEATAGDPESGGLEPAWPDVDNALVFDYHLQWRECTPFIGIAVPAPAQPTIARVAAGGTYAAGRDVYIKIALDNGSGETNIADQTAKVLVNTVLNDAVRVSRPIIPAWNADIVPPYQITGWTVYAADVATGAAAPADAAYRKVGATQALATATFDVTVTGAGAFAVLVNTAVLGATGNICAGVRWMVFAFENSNGYVSGITDPVPVSTVASMDGQEILAARIPIGKANTRRRICAFTVAGGSKAGPYFYLAADDKISDPDSPDATTVDVTKTTIEDNVTTLARFSFPDFYLEVSPLEATDWFNKAEIPGCTEAYFSKTLNRMILTGVPGYPSGHWISPEDDPETFYLTDASTSSELEVSERDGKRTVCWRELDRIQYSLKENGGFRVDPTGPNPQKWDAVPVWSGSGPGGPRACVSTDRFMVYAGEAGAYLFTGNGKPDYISPELETTWKRLNRPYKHTISVTVDEEAHEIHFLLPLDNATKPNYRLRLKVRDWTQLTSEPIVLARSGKLVPNTMGRRWSVEPLDANVIFIAERDLAVSVDHRIDHRQVLYGRNNGVGLVSMERPDYYADEDVAGTAVAIDDEFQTVYADNPKLMDMWLGGVTVAAKGHGLMKVTAVPGKGDELDLTARRDCNLTTLNDDDVETFDEVIVDLGARSAHHERWAVRFESDGTPGNWFELHHAQLHLNPKYQTRKA